MESLTAFLDMGGHAAFIWPAYGMVFLVLIVLWGVSRRYVKSSAAELHSLNADRPKRNRGGPDET